MFRPFKDIIPVPETENDVAVVRVRLPKQKGACVPVAKVMPVLFVMPEKSTFGNRGDIPESKVTVWLFALKLLLVNFAVSCGRG